MSKDTEKGQAHAEEMTSHLLALLYPDDGEESYDEESSTEESYGDAAELDDFRSLLSHYRELPEEDAPVAVSNQLLAFAAQNAPRPKKAKSGRGIFAWLSDFLLPTAYHPGLASAASLVLVAGLAGTLYVNGKGQVAEPVVATQAPSPSFGSAVGDPQGTARLAAPEELMERKQEAENAATALVAADEEPAEEELDSDEGGAADGESLNDPFALDLAPKSKRALPSSAEKGKSGKALGAASAGNESRASSTKKTAGKKEFDFSDDSLDGTRTQNKARKKAPARPRRVAKDAKEVDADNRRDTQNTNLPKAPANDPAPAPGEQAAPEPEGAPPPAKPAPAKPAPVTTTATDKSAPDQGDAPSDDSGGEGEDSSSKTKSDTSADDASAKAATLHKRAIRLAKKGQCAKVKSIGQQIRKLSSSYYDRTFLSDKKLTACLAPEVKKK